MRDWHERLELWRRCHAHVLGCKGLVHDDALRAAIDHDRVVALAAARTLDVLAVRTVLDDLFADRDDLRDGVLAAVDTDLVDHLGFRIREPLDVWLEGLAHWAPRLGYEVVGTKRFTPSEAFRERVGAMAEMAQVWLRPQVGEGRTIELELFDIHRPNPGGAGQLRGLRAGSGTRALLAAAAPDALPALLAGDDIWHYGVRIVDHAAVEGLHERLRAVVADDQRFRLRTGQTVANRWHGSVHTKLANVERGLEVELLTYRVDWREVGP